MAGIENMARLQAKLSALARKAIDKTASVIVGYTQAYAIYVHENMEAEHKEGKQAKFLEGPARRLSNSGELGKVAAATYAKTKSMEQSLLMAGLRLQRESQQVVPIDTGALKASAFTRKE